MLTVDEALRAVLARVRPLTPVRRPLDDAVGLTLAADVMADLDLPPFDKSLVDGYAVRSSDLDGDPPHRLRIGEELPAGRTPTRPLGPREAAPIMTGAPLPSGADAVVMVEETTNEESDVVLRVSAVAGQFRLCRGREMRAGEVILRPGERITPIRAGLLASIGCVEPLVNPRPRVSILPTGDELVDPARAPGPGQIRNSNGTMLRALASGLGAEARVLPIAPDEPEGLRSLLREGLGSDVLLITGGVSAGNRDLVPESLEALGVSQVFHKVRLKPGKPLWFGVGPDRDGRPGTFVFGLPGNPVSGVVGFLLFVRPALKTLLGATEDADSTRLGRLAVPFRHRGDRPTYHPATWEADGHIRPLNWAGSADLRTVASADGFVRFPAGDRDYGPGETLDFLPFT